MLIRVFLSIDLRWRDSEVVLAGYWLIKRELLTDRLGLTYKGMVPAKFTNSKPIALFDSNRRFGRHAEQGNDSSL